LHAWLHAPFAQEENGSGCSITWRKRCCGCRMIIGHFIALPGLCAAQLVHMPQVARA
jgi:hypothetical protein